MMMTLARRQAALTKRKMKWQINSTINKMVPMKKMSKTNIKSRNLSLSSSMIILLEPF